MVRSGRWFPRAKQHSDALRKRSAAGDVGVEADRLADHPGDAAARRARRDEWSSSVAAVTLRSRRLPQPLRERHSSGGVLMVWWLM